MSKTSTIILLLPAFADVHMNVGNIRPTFQMSSFFGEKSCCGTQISNNMGVPMLFYVSKHRHVAGLWQVLELWRVNMGKTTIIQPMCHYPSCKLVPEQTTQTACPTKWSAPPTVVHKMSGTNSNANSTLTTALKETLERTGMLDDVRAQLRTMVLRCMNECLPTPTSSKTQALPPLLSTNWKFLDQWTDCRISFI